MTDPFSPHLFLDLEWEVLKPITHVPHFQGMLWSSMFRHPYNHFLHGKDRYSETGLRVAPVDFGVPRYEIGDRFSLGVMLPETEAMRFFQVVMSMGNDRHTHGQFEPNNTIRLKRMTCRRSGATWPAEEADPLRFEDCLAAASLWTDSQVQLWAHAPLRLTIPKADGPTLGFHEFADEPYFRGDPGAQQALAGKSGLDPDTFSLLQDQVFGLWMDLFYGRFEKQKQFGGFVGVLPLTLDMDRDELARFFWFCYQGTGKNRAFGLGRFHLPGLDERLGFAVPAKSKTLFQQLIDVEATKEAVAAGSGSKDAYREAFKWSPAALQHHLKSVESGTYRPREAQVDHFLQQRATDLLAESLDESLCDAVYAARPSRSRKRGEQKLKQLQRSGYQVLLELDLSRWTQQVHLEKLRIQLKALYPGEPLLDLLFRWLPENGKGLAEDSPLTPVLMNLYLKEFDRFFLEEPLLLRFENTALFLGRDTNPNLVAQIQNYLNPLGLDV